MLRSGLHQSDIITGFEIALEKTKELLEKSISLNLHSENDGVNSQGY